MPDELIFESLEPFIYQNQAVSADIIRVPNLYKGTTSFLVRIPLNSPLKVLSTQEVFAVHTSNPSLDWNYGPGEKSLKGGFSEEQEILHRLLTNAIRKHFYPV